MVRVRINRERRVLAALFFTCESLKGYVRPRAHMTARARLGRCPFMLYYEYVLGGFIKATLNTTDSMSPIWSLVRGATLPHPAPRHHHEPGSARPKDRARPSPAFPGLVDAHVPSSTRSSRSIQPSALLHAPPAGIPKGSYATVETLMRGAPKLARYLQPRCGASPPWGTPVAPLATRVAQTTPDLEATPSARAAAGPSSPLDVSPELCEPDDVCGEQGAGPLFVRRERRSSLVRCPSSCRPIPGGLSHGAPVVWRRYSVSQPCPVADEPLMSTMCPAGPASVNYRRSTSRPAVSSALTVDTEWSRLSLMLC